MLERRLPHVGRRWGNPSSLAFGLVHAYARRGPQTTQRRDVVFHPLAKPFLKNLTLGIEFH